jgi:hypothetical protein
MREAEQLFYDHPQANVVNLELEQAILVGSDPTGNIPDLEEENW